MEKERKKLKEGGKRGRVYLSLVFFLGGVNVFFLIVFYILFFLNFLKFLIFIFIVWVSMVFVCVFIIIFVFIKFFYMGNLFFFLKFCSMLVSIEGMIEGERRRS